MFSCKKSVDALLDYLDGQMSAEEEKHLQEHLSACPPCVDFLRTYKATPSLCKRALAAKMPSELGQKLTDFLRSKAKKTSP